MDTFPPDGVYKIVSLRGERGFATIRAGAIVSPLSGQIKHLRGYMVKSILDRYTIIHIEEVSPPCKNA